MKRLPLILFVLTLLLGTVLRFYQLSTFPVSLNLDEVAIGYNAYSILETGKDEFGTSFPLAFRSHDDYKAPLYIYLTTIPIYFFGLNAFAVRFISASVGGLSVLLTYFLTQELVKKKSHKYLPLLTSFLLAISPWHLQYSRPAFEVNLATFLIIVGVWAYLKGLKKPVYWFVSAVSFALSLYAYHSTKVFVPLFALVLAWHAKKELRTNVKYLGGGIIIFALLVLPLLPLSFSEQGQLRFKGTNIFNTPTLVDLNRELKIDQWRKGREYQAKLFHNEVIVGTQVFLRGYFSHFSYELLFFGESGPPKNYTPNVGLLYLWELPFIVLGLYALFRSKYKYRFLILGWILLSPIASGLTWDYPSITRITIMLPTWQILTAIGLYKTYDYLATRWRIFFTLVMVPIIGFFFLLYLHNYYRIAPLLYAEAWQSGYPEAVEYAQKHKDEVNKVIVSTALRQPQNFFAFYSHYEPKTYIEVDGGTKSGGFEENGNAFGKYEFKAIDWNPNKLEQDILYVDLIREANKTIDFEKIIQLPNGEEYIGVYRKN